MFLIKIKCEEGPIRKESNKNMLIFSLKQKLESIGL
jgi:hypothetical protein